MKRRSPLQKQLYAPFEQAEQQARLRSDTLVKAKIKRMGDEAPVGLQVRFKDSKRRKRLGD